MNLETYAPAASLVLLGLLGLIAFLRVRALIKRYGLSELNPEPVEAVKAEPWWTAHLDDYTHVSPPVPVKPQEAVAARWPELKLEAELQDLEATPPVQVVAADEPQYVMTAAVELWFGDSCVAVRPGSDTDARFLRFAAVLLDDLESSRWRR